jgi:hypothetical protein
MDETPYPEPMPGVRYYVTELRGYPELTENHRGSLKSPSPGGVSYTVHDRAYNCRVVAAYRSEDYAPSFGRRSMWAKARAAAEAHAARLNAAHEREVVQP